MLNFADYGKPVPEKGLIMMGSLGWVQVYRVRKLSKNDKTERPIIFYLNKTTYEKVIHYGLCGGHVDRMREGNHE